MYSKEKLSTLSKDDLLKICRNNRIHVVSGDIEKSEVISNILRHFRRQSRFYQSDNNESIMTIDQLESNGTNNTMMSTSELSENINNNNSDNNGMNENNLIKLSSSLSNYSFNGDLSSYKPPPTLPISVALARRKTIFKSCTSSNFNNFEMSEDCSSANVEGNVDLNNYQNTGSLCTDDKKSIIKNILNNNLLLHSTTSSSTSTLPPLQSSTSSNNLFSNSINSITNCDNVILPTNPIDMSFQSPMSPTSMLSPSSQKEQENIIDKIASLDLTKISPRKSDYPLSPTDHYIKNDNTTTTNTTTTTTTITKSPKSPKSPNPTAAAPPQIENRKDSIMAFKKRLSLMKLKDMSTQKKTSSSANVDSRYAESSRPIPKLNPHLANKPKVISTVSSTANRVIKKPDFDKIHQADFNKLQSITDYETKRKDLWSKLGFTNLPFLSNTTNTTTTDSTTTESTTTTSASTDSNVDNNNDVSMDDSIDKNVNSPKQQQQQQTAPQLFKPPINNFHPINQPITPKKTNLSSTISNPFNLSSSVNLSTVKTPTKFKSSLSNTILNSPISTTTPSKSFQPLKNLANSLASTPNTITSASTSSTPNTTTTTTSTSTSSTKSTKETLNAQSTVITKKPAVPIFTSTTKSTPLSSNKPTTTTTTPSLFSKPTTTTNTSATKSTTVNMKPTSTLNSTTKPTLNGTMRPKTPTSSSSSSSTTSTSTTPLQSTTTTTTTSSTSTSKLPSYAQPTFASNLMNTKSKPTETSSTTTTKSSIFSKPASILKQTASSLLGKTSSTPTSSSDRLKPKNISTTPSSSSSLSSTPKSTSTTTPKSTSPLTNITNTPPKETPTTTTPKSNIFSSTAPSSTTTNAATQSKLIKKRKSIKSTVVISGTEKRTNSLKKTSDQSHDSLIQRKRLEQTTPKNISTK